MLLAKQGVDVNQAKNNGATPLFIASWGGHSEVVSMLLVKQGVAKPGDHVILTRGDHMNAHGGTNTMKVMVMIRATGIPNIRAASGS